LIVAEKYRLFTFERVYEISVCSIVHQHFIASSDNKLHCIGVKAGCVDAMGENVFDPIQ
jgi:hypothetical protein